MSMKSCFDQAMKILLIVALGLALALAARGVRNVFSTFELRKLFSSLFLTHCKPRPALV